MAPSSGYHMVPKAVRAIKYIISRSSDFIRARVTVGAQPSLEAVPASARSSSHSIHPAALLRQSRTRLSSRQTRLFSTTVAKLGRLGVRAAGVARSTSTHFPVSATRTALARSTQAPFASPLRPNLTGGTLPRSAGGYGLGGGGFGAARHFSHTGAAQAQVVHNVHAAVRAFLLQGGKPLYDGTDPRTGTARFRAAGAAEVETHRTLYEQRSATGTRGTNLDFRIVPNITALHASAPGASTTLEEPAILSGLAANFAQQLRELSAVYADLKRLSRLGALPISQPDATTIRVRFPGCDAAAVTALCDEMGVSRGLVREDDGWQSADDLDAVIARPDRDVDMALLFPWAPSAAPSSASCDVASLYFDEVPPPRLKPSFSADTLEWRSMLAPPSDDSMGTAHSFAIVSPAPHGSNSPFESLAASDASELPWPMDSSLRPGPTDYEGIEGIYRFLQELEGAERYVAQRH